VICFYFVVNRFGQSGIAMPLTIVCICLILITPPPPSPPLYTSYIHVATVSTNAAESWITFFFLSSASFCGYLFARVALVDNSRNKRGGIPSSLLLLSLVVLSFLTVFALFYLDWQIPMTLMIERVD